MNYTTNVCLSTDADGNARAQLEIAIKEGGNRDELTALLYEYAAKVARIARRPPWKVEVLKWKNYDNRGAVIIETHESFMKNGTDEALEVLRRIAQPAE